MSNATILVVEDENIVAKDIQISLRKLGYAVPAIATSGRSAIEKAAEFSPDLVLMDIHLKGDMDGVEAGKELHARFNVPVIYLTAYSDENTLERAKLTEAVGYLLKPFKARELHTMIQMALSKHRMERKLKEHEQWLAAVLKSIGDAVIATDIKGVVTFMNPVAEIMTGWSQEHALGRDSTEVFPIVDDQTRTVIENSVNEVLQYGKTACIIPEQRLLINRNGKEIPITKCAAPIQGDTGDVTGVVLAFQDITQRQRAEAEIHKALAKEKELNELKSHFISTTSHEFRTPLSSILSSAELLEHYSYKWEENKKIEHLHRIQNSAESMTQLLEDVLLVNQVEAGKLEFKPVPLNLIQFCHDLAEEMQLIAEGKHTINFISQGECKSDVCFDEKLLRHILTNLLSNALKYSPVGTIVHFNLICDQQVAIFCIKDNGIGIPTSDQAQLFQSFYRASNVGTTSGTGLGLTIVKQSVDLHGGEITFTSEVGVGTTFIVTIPLHYGV